MKYNNYKVYKKALERLVDDDGQVIHICSHCESLATHDRLWEWLTNYCPWCGAKMLHIEREGGVSEEIIQYDDYHKEVLPNE